MLPALLRTFSLPEWRHHAVRHATALLAVMLGVALAFSVHLINLSALSEFSAAVRSVNGGADFELRSVRGSFDEALFARVATHPLVAQASAVVEIDAHAVDAQGQRAPLKVLGIDPLAVAPLSPSLVPVLAAGRDRMTLFSPDAVSLNAAARARLGLEAGDLLRIQVGLHWIELPVVGSVAAAGAPLAVMDIAGAQGHFQSLGRLSRIDVKLAEGASLAGLRDSLPLPPGVQAVTPDEGALKISNVSRAYRVNLTVLALVALFTGAFLVYSVLSLSVARRAQQFALLGVLGLTPPERLRLVLLESLALGTLGSVAGLALGSGLAALALRVLGGDLGGGYFAGVAPALQWDGLVAGVYGVLGVAAAGVGGWWPARAAQSLAPAQTLKGLGGGPRSGAHRTWSLGLMGAALLLALTPPVWGLPLAAYGSVALLLVGGITALPGLIALGYDRLAPHVAHRLLPLLAVERARRVRESAAVAVSGVVASLSLAVALTVMVASFRDSVTHWLDVVLPADLYVRTATGTSAADTVYFSPGLVQALAGRPGVRQLGTQRTLALQLDPARPAVTLISRDLSDPARQLALVGDALPVPAGQTGLWVSEAMVDLYGARPGSLFTPLSG